MEKLSVNTGGIVSSTNTGGIVSRTALLLNSSMYSDAEILVRKSDGTLEKYFVHKLILGIGSKIFSRYFYELSKRELKITGVTSSTVFKMLQYLYTDKLELKSVKEAHEVYKLAKKFQVEDLERKCAYYVIEDNLTVENLFPQYECALSQSISDLVISCQNFVQKHTDSVLKSPHFNDASIDVLEDILKLDRLAVDSELDILDAIIKWARHECARKGLPHEDFSVRECIEPLLKYTRFLSLTAQEFCDFVEKNNIFTSLESSILTRKLLQPSHIINIPKSLCSITEKRLSGHYAAASIDEWHAKPAKKSEQNSPELKADSWMLNKTSCKEEKPLNAPKVRNKITSDISPTYRILPDPGETYSVARNYSEIHKSVPPVSCVSPYNPRNQIQRNLTFDFLLEDMQKGLKSAFVNDIKCAAEMQMVRGNISIHGIELKIKNHKFSKSDLTVCLRLLGFTPNPITETYDKELINEIFPIKFPQPVELREGCRGGIEVIVEDLNLDRCSVSRNATCELNCGLNVLSKISLNSNQVNEEGCAFPISRIIYSPF